MDTSLVVGRDPAPPPGEGPVEVVERKGLGHPDTLCDGVAEAVSRALSRHYLARFDTVLHHNVDKVLLVGGQSRPAFGGGEVVEPMTVVLAGRATFEAKGETIPVAELAEDATRGWLSEHLHALDPVRHLRVEVRLKPGSADLVDLFLRAAATGRFLANDTSIGVGFFPLSPLERAVRRIGETLTAPETRAAHPELGEDTKLMAVRQGDTVELTVAAAFVDRWLADLADYRRRREDLLAWVDTLAGGVLGGPVAATVNAADDLESGSVFLTVTGTSAEAGDDGEAGRGNRAGGLITPYRPMTLESVAGKNPVSHVGKIYNVAAGRMAHQLVNRVPGIAEASCVLVSRIGEPVDTPQLLHLRVREAEGADPDRVVAAAGDVARSLLADLPSLWAGILDAPLLVL